MSTNENQKTTRHLLAGFTGGLTSAVCLQPLDLVKTRVQQSKNNSITSVLKDISAIKQLWRGTLPSALRTSFGSALYLSTLHVARSNLARLKNSQTPLFNVSSKLPKLSAYENIFIGMASRAFVGYITMPITVVKIRFESNLYQYKSMKEAVIDIFQNNGTRGFFTGFGATCLRDAPYAGLYISSYEQLKSTLPRLMNVKFEKNKELDHFSSGLINSTSAIVASIFATVVTAPFDTIKTRMQLSPQDYKTFRQTTIKLYNENWTHFFNGLSLRLIRKAGSAAIAWCIYEELVKI
jgi:solute carrier family 25 protein 38